MMVGADHPAPKTTITRRQVIADLKARGFTNSLRHRTAGKLMDLYQLDPRKYRAYLDLFTAIHAALKLPNLVLTLILPSASLLNEMDPAILAEKAEWIMSAYTSATSRLCDLRNLPNAYPQLTTS
jgi:hypothetical protein